MTYSLNIFFSQQILAKSDVSAEKNLTRDNRRKKQKYSEISWVLYVATINM